jgi:prepilin-type N-terminal cleavage/methylation domain-containing protein
MLSRQRGFTLPEPLAAMAILALAVLGMLLAQLRTQADMQASLHRMLAVRLIDDFAERIEAHRDGLRSPAASVAAEDAMPALPDCESRACGPDTLWQWDLAAWQRAVAQALPRGRARVFDTGNDDVLGLMVAWRSSIAMRDDDMHARLAGLEEAPAGAACPSGFLCHFGHVRR